MTSVKDVFDAGVRIYDLLGDEESRWTYKNRLDFLLTGDVNYIHEITRYKYPEHFEGLKRVCQTAKELIVYGAGYFCEYTVSACRFYGETEPAFICDGDSKKWNTFAEGIRVISPETLKREHRDASVIVGSFIYGEAIKKELMADFPEDRVFVFGQEPEMDMAKQQYFPKDIIQFDTDGECFVDGGSYDLATSIVLFGMAGVKKIYAFEADLMNEKKMREAMGAHPEIDVDLYMKGIWDREEILFFESGDEMESKVTTDSIESNTKIEAVALDDVIDGPVTFIKMDIEGSELKALKGARGIIQKYKPKLAICIYHKPEDMVELPLYIHELVPEYKLFLRAHSVLPFETVLYAVMYEGDIP